MAHLSGIVARLMPSYSASQWAAIMGRRPRAEKTLSTIRISARHHDTGRAPSGYPSLSAMKPVMRNSGRGRADERDCIAASLSGWYNQLRLLFNHLFLVFSLGNIIINYILILSKNHSFPSAL
jgi:hypothetical protein